MIQVTSVIAGQMLDVFFNAGHRDVDTALMYANGDKYEGQWCNDMRCGLGTLLFADGSSFVGQWIDDSYGNGAINDAT